MSATQIFPHCPLPVTSHFVMSHIHKYHSDSDTSCRLVKCIPAERLRLVEVPTGTVDYILAHVSRCFVTLLMLSSGLILEHSTVLKHNANIQAAFMHSKKVVHGHAL